MKLLKEDFRKFKNRLNLIYMNGNGPNPEGEGDWTENELVNKDIERDSLNDEEKIKRIIDLVKSPIQFSLRDIKFIEENKSLIRNNKDFRYHFSKISEYYLSLAVVKDSIIPSRILYSLGTSSLLREFLPPKIKNGIELVISQKLKEIDDLANKDVKAWKKGETSQIISLYKLLKGKNKETSNNKINEVFKKINKRLIEKAVDLANSSNDLSTTDKLLIWEIRRLIPDSFKISSEIKNLIGGTSEQNANELLSEILNNDENGKKNNPDLILVWEILEDLAYQHDITVNENNRKKLRNFILRGNATYFLEGIRNISPKVLLPVHLQALNDLDSPNFKELWDKTNEHFDIESISISDGQKETAIKQKEYEEKELQLKKKRKELEEENINKYLDSDKIKNKELIEEYKTKKNEFETLFNEEKINGKSLLEIAKEIKDVFKSSEKRQKIADEYFGKSIDVLAYKDSSPEERFKVLSKFKDGLKKMRLRGFNNLIPKSVEEDNENIQFLSNEEQDRLEAIFLNLKENNLIKNTKKLSKEIEDIREDLLLELVHDDESELAKIKKELSSLTENKNKEDIANIEKEAIHEVYKDIIGTREKIFNEYDQELKQRITSHTLHAADFQVLLDNELRPKGATVEHLKLYEFRNKFKKTLDSIDLDLNGIETAISNINLDDPNPDLDELQPFLQKIEENIGISAFRKEMKNDLNLLDSPQIKDEVLKGLMGYFSNEITDKISTAMGTFAQDNETYLAQRNFFINQVRAHNNISSKSDITAIDNAYHRYFTNKTHLDKKVEVERNQLEGALEGLSDNEKERIREAYEKGVSYLRNGYNSKHFQFPGSQKLNEANIQAQSFSLEFSNFLKKHQNNLKDLIIDVSNEAIDPQTRNLSFRNFKNTWNQEGKQELDNKISKFRNLCKETIFNEVDEHRNRIYDEFLNEYFKTIDTAVKNLQAGIDELENANFTGKEQIWTKIRDDFGNLKKWISFDQGELTKHKVELEERLFSHKEKDENNKTIDVNGFSESVQHLKSLGVFDDRNAAQKEFDKKRIDFNEKAKKFDDNTNSVKRKIEADKNKLNDEKFEQKYGMHKHEANTTVSHFDDYKKDFNNQWNKFNDKNYFDTWWKDYEKDGESRFKAIEEFQNFERLNVMVNEMTNKTEDLNKWLDDWNKYGETERQNRWYNRITTQSFSLYSVYLLIKQNMEIVDTNFKRKQDRMAYNVGQQIYGDSLWGKEFRRMAEDSESERVKQWEGNYSSLEVWTVAEYLYKTNDPDEAKACINLLNEKGYLKWDNPRLWRTLMRLQSNIIFNDPEDMELEMKVLIEKIGNACEIIWTKDDFNKWNTSIDDNMKKMRSSHEKEFRDLNDSRINGKSALSLKLADMLKRWDSGDTEDVYPDKFQAFLHLAFQQGKLNTQPDRRWYYLIKGVTTKNPQGEALLPKSIFMQFYGELLSEFPYFEFFADKSSWKKDGKIVPPNTPGAHTSVWTYEDFLAWGDMMGDAGGTFFVDGNSQAEEQVYRFFYEIVDMSADAKSRVNRMTRGANKNFDHDDGETFFTGLSTRQVNQLLASRSEGTQQASDDFWRAYLGGFEKFIVNKKRMIEERDKEYGLNNPDWQTMRKNTLLDIGDKIKTATMVVQILSGNLKTDNQTPLIWDEKSWTKEDGLSVVNAKNEKIKVINVVSNLLDRVDGDSDNYKETIQSDFYKKSIKFDTLKELPEWQATGKKLGVFFGEEIGGKYFSDTEAIWNVLQNYGEGNSGLSMAA